MAARDVRPIVAILLVCVAGTARAQQPSAAVSAAAQVLTGEEFRLAGQNRFEPDIGVLLFDPWFRFGTLEVAVSATRRDEQAVLGRSFVHLDGAKLAGLSWTIDAGDAWRMPTLSDFGFANLFAPPVTFEGASVSGASARTQVSIYGGRVTAQQNIFGTDTIPVGQQVYQASASHRVNERLDVYGRGAHVRNGTVKLYPAFVDVSTDVSGGTRYRVTPSVAVSAEAGYAQFRRRGSSAVEHSPSALAGAIWSVPRGWLQFNAHYLPLGYFPVINFPYIDRKGVFAAGEWDAHRLVRLFAGAEVATTGLDEAAADAAASGVAPGTQTRGYGGVRVRVGDRSLVSVRVEDGGREIRPSSFNGGYESDTGVVSADWHAGFERWNAFARYERRENVEPISQGSTFTQHDAAVHTYFSVGPGRQNLRPGAGLPPRRPKRRGADPLAVRRRCAVFTGALAAAGRGQRGPDQRLDLRSRREPAVAVGWALRAGCPQHLPLARLLRRSVSDRARPGEPVDDADNRASDAVVPLRHGAVRGAARFACEKRPDGASHRHRLRRLERQRTA